MTAAYTKLSYTQLYMEAKPSWTHQNPTSDSPLLLTLSPSSRPAETVVFFTCE